MSGTVTTIDVVASHDDTHELLRDKIHLVRRLRATEHAKGFGCTFIDCSFQGGGRSIQSFVPRGGPESALPLVADEWLSEANVWFSH
jgi:hypothetical protein